MKATFNPDRVKTARIAKGLKQVDIASRLGFSRQYMHQVESGERTPNDESIEALAELSGVMPSYYFRNSLPRVSPEDCNFRKQKTTPKMVQEQLIAKASMFGEISDWVDQYVDLPEPQFSEAQISSYPDIENAAMRCRENWGLGTSAPISHLTRVAERAGALVMNISGVHEKISALSITTRRPIILHSESMNQPTRLRFDIGHELGHFVMHSGIQTGDALTENQANYFAGALLLPRNSFLKEYPRSKRTDWRAIFDLKQRWKVSAQAIIRRAYNLDLISAAQYKSSMIYISKNGYRKAEPFEPESCEQPEVVQASFSVINKHFSVYADDICEELGITRKLLSDLTGASFQERPCHSSKVVPLNTRKKDVH